MDKIVDTAFGKKVYLLGEDDEGTWYWLQEATWDCDWYWGFGYVRSFTNNKKPSSSKDINMHSHFDVMFGQRAKKPYSFDILKKKTFEEKEGWKIQELLASSYIARRYADMLYSGGAHVSENCKADLIRNKSEYDRINKEIIPSLMEDIYEILSPKEGGK